MNPRDPIELFDQLREYLFRYYDTPFAIADKLVQAERRRLLDRDRVTFREPWLELIPEYAPAPGTFETSAERTGASEDLVAFARCGLIPPAIASLHAHQEAALAAALRGDHVVLTAGTGCAFAGDSVNVGSSQTLRGDR